MVEDDLANPQPVEEAVRPIAAVELVASAEAARPVAALPVGTELDRPEDYGLVTDESQSGNGRATG